MESDAFITHLTYKMHGTVQYSIYSTVWYCTVLYTVQYCMYCTVLYSTVATVAIYTIYIGSIHGRIRHSAVATQLDDLPIGYDSLLRGAGKRSTQTH